jgi:hypothetical protein
MQEPAHLRFGLLVLTDSSPLSCANIFAGYFNTHNYVSDAMLQTDSPLDLPDLLQTLRGEAVVSSEFAALEMHEGHLKVVLNRCPLHMRQNGGHE